MYCLHSPHGSSTDTDHFKYSTYRLWKPSSAPHLAAQMWNFCSEPAEFRCRQILPLNCRHGRFLRHFGMFFDLRMNIADFWIVLFPKKIFKFEFTDCGQVKDYALVLNLNIVTNRHYIRIFQMQTACIKIKILQYNIIMIAIRKHDPHFFVSLWDFSFLYS